MVKKLFKYVKEKIKNLSSDKKKKITKTSDHKIEQSKKESVETKAEQPLTKKHPVNRPQQNKNKKEFNITEVKAHPIRKPNQYKNNLDEKPETDSFKKNRTKKDLKVFEDWDISKYQVEVQEGKTRFHDLNLPNQIMHAIADLGFQYCTPIQKEILTPALTGKDATGRAQTGTGKTAAFLITILNKYLKEKSSSSRRPGVPKALILAPTRELVIQIANDAKLLSKYIKINIVEIFGGMDYNKQRIKLRKGPVDIIVATPGRLLDFMHKKDVYLGNVEVLVIDEADRMLDMGFIPDVRKIIQNTPPKIKRQTLLFSATLSSQVKRLSSNWTKDAINVEINPEKTAGENIEQIVYITSNDEKFSLLFNIITKQKLERIIVFTNRRDEAKNLDGLLTKYGISCKLISGEVDQRLRLKTLDDFKAGNIRVLVATDVAGRGIHVENISHVINYTLPEDPEDYVHRIGRTGRAGAEGTSISFASEDDSFNIPAIEKFIGNKLNCIYPPEELLEKVKSQTVKAE